MKDKVKNSVKKTTATSKRVVSNAEQFVQASALLTIASFSYWAIQQSELKLAKPVYWAVLVALIVVGLRGAYELVKFLDKK